ELRNRRRWKRLEILAGEELRRLVAAEFVPPQADEIRAYFAANPERFVQPEQYRLAAIRFPLEETSLVEEYRRAEALLARLRAGDLSFEQAAREFPRRGTNGGFSQHPTAPAGGELGWRARRQIAAFGPAVHMTVTEMKPGELSELVEEDENLWIFKLLDFRPRRPMSFEEASLGANRALGNERLKALQQEIEERVSVELRIQVVDPGAPIPGSRKQETPASASASQGMTGATLQAAPGVVVATR
ncbi:MAG: peptidyl-prolyl cis-trans isomerase, partial [bacterium]|nr:peptidyl-prolyl cis-trans isomerase [bacterium]